MQEIFKWKKGNPSQTNTLCETLTQIEFHTDEKDRKMIPDVFFRKKRKKIFKDIVEN